MIAAQKTHYSPRFASLSQAEPFHSAEEAWFWTMAALMARRDGARIVAGKGDKQRPCEPDDVVKCLDRLYRHRRIDLTHARILRIWGERGAAPDARYPSEKHDWRLWREALDRLEWPLHVNGIVVCSHTFPMRGLKIRRNLSGSSSVAALISPGFIHSGAAFAIASPPSAMRKAGRCLIRFRAGFWWRACRLMQALTCRASTAAPGFV